MKIEDKLFILIIVLIMLGGLVKPILFPKETNYLENREANQIPELSLTTILDKTYQDDFELALADQIPLAGNMKLTNKTFNILLTLAYSNISNNNYVSLGSGIYLIENYITYGRGSLKSKIPQLDIKISNFSLKKEQNPDVEFYLYYIEKDTDINFEDNDKLGAYEYIIENLNPTIKAAKFEINNIDKYKEYFYRTDHHWNYKGSYKGYQELTELMGLDNIITPDDEVCLNLNWSGSKARAFGGQQIFKEEFCAYKFNFPEHTIFINNESANNYGKYEEFFNGSGSEVSYGIFYGGDVGLLEFNYHQENKENLLIIGESYDNAINELLASHFNKTYNVDLRAYEEDIGQEFNLNEFISEHDIDKVLLIGNIDYYTSNVFVLN